MCHLVCILCHLVCAFVCLVCVGVWRAQLGINTKISISTAVIYVNLGVEVVVCYVCRACA